jgi:hypothetical protein
MEAWKPKWMSRRKALNAASNDHCSYDEVPPNYASGKGRFEDYLPVIVVLYPGELLKQCHKRRSCEKRSGAPSPESMVEEGHHKGSKTMNKE